MVTNAIKMTASPEESKGNHRLGVRALLDKVDKLRELGISHLVPLPQVRYQETVSQTKVKVADR
jgi:hypothetical protein